jgi:uncharacterized protein (TIGR03437 family)
MDVTLGSLGNIVIADSFNDQVRQAGMDGRLRSIAGLEHTSLHQPHGVCTDASGTVYITDTLNHRVLRVAAGAASVIVAGGGSPGDTGDGGPARLAQLNQPAACAINTAGDLFVADTSNHKIRKIKYDGIISTVAGTGVAGVSGDEGPAGACGLDAPAGVAVDDDGNIFISDTGNHRIRQITPDGTIHTIAGTGVAGFGGEGGPAADARLNAPAGLRLDGSGNLYIADTLNDRIRRLVPDGVVVEPLIAPAVVTVENAASLISGPVAPGELVVLFGHGIGPATAAVGVPNATGQLGTSAGGTEVWFDGVAAPVFYAQTGQVNVQVPYTVAGNVETHVAIHYNSKLAGIATLPVADAAPGLFPVALNQNGSPNSEAEPAGAQTVLTFYATGEGLTEGPNVAGKAAVPPYPKPKLPVSLILGGARAEILYAGSAPEYVGLLQVNARVPASLPKGRTTATLTIGTATSPQIAVWLE